jgi:hypothetical protein
MSRDMLANATVSTTVREDALSRVPVPALAPVIAAAFAIGQPLLAHLIGILRWDQCFCGGAEAGWGLGLAAVLWYTAISVPAGLLIARRLIGRPARVRPSEFVSGIVPAALGALLATPVVATLARSAVVPGVDYPGLTAGFGVPVGAAIGVLAAGAALASAAVIRGLVASWLWVWSVGLVAAVLLLLAESGGPQPLGGVDVAFADGRVADGLLRAMSDVGWLIALVAPAVAAAFVAYRSVRSGSGAAAAMLGGAAGALLIVAAYRGRGDVPTGYEPWYALAIAEFALSAVAAVAAALFARVRFPVRGPAG